MQMGNADSPQPNAWADCGSEHKMFAWETYTTLCEKSHLLEKKFTYVSAL